MYVENPKERIKNHDLSKNAFLLYLACIMCEKWPISYNQVVFLSYQLSTLFWKHSCMFHLYFEEYGWVQRQVSIHYFFILNIFTAVILSAD